MIKGNYSNIVKMRRHLTYRILTGFSFQVKYIKRQWIFIINVPVSIPLCFFR
jgi:hypothetical protein